MTDDLATQEERSRAYMKKMAEKEDRAVTLHGGGRRCAIQQTPWIDGWWVSHSPRNDNSNAEGSWSDWVLLARMILEHNEKIKRGEATEGIE